MHGRIEFVILRTGRSPPAAPHHASLRRSCSWLQAGERLPEEDFHLSDHLRFQAHECGNLLPLLVIGDLSPPFRLCTRYLFLIMQRLSLSG
jgi:hypothetical protein